MIFLKNLQKNDNLLFSSIKLLIFSIIIFINLISEIKYVIKLQYINKFKFLLIY